MTFIRSLGVSGAEYQLVMMTPPNGSALASGMKDKRVQAGVPEIGIDAERDLATAFAGDGGGSGIGVQIVARGAASGEDQAAQGNGNDAHG